MQFNDDEYSQTQFPMAGGCVRNAVGGATFTLGDWEASARVPLCALWLPWAMRQSVSARMYRQGDSRQHLGLQVRRLLHRLPQQAELRALLFAVRYGSQRPAVCLPQEVCVDRLGGQLPRQDVHP